MPKVWIKDPADSNWKQVQKIWVRRNGVWKQVKKTYVNNNGDNQLVYPDYTGNVTYTTPGIYSYTVPAGIETLQFIVAGAGGGGGGKDATSLGYPGSAGNIIIFTSNTFTSNTTITVGVGAAGQAGLSNVSATGGGAGGIGANGWFSGNIGGDSGSEGYAGAGGGGGAASFINYLSANIAVAAGGNGGQGASSIINEGNPSIIDIVAISVIDESSPTASTIRNDWDGFRSRYPDRIFWLLQPTGYSISALKIPDSYTTDPKANGPVTVNRDRGNIESKSDWFALCGLELLSAGSVISLAIDNSGSMKTSDVQASYNFFKERCAAAGLQLVEQTMSGERWAVPHDKEIISTTPPAIQPTPGPGGSGGIFAEGEENLIPVGGTITNGTNGGRPGIAGNHGYITIVPII